MSIYDPHIFFDQIEKKFGRNQGAYQFGFDAIPSGRYFGGVLRTLAGLGLSGVPVGTGVDRRDLQGSSTQLSTVDEQQLGRTGLCLSPSIVGGQASQDLSYLQCQKKETAMDLGAIMGSLGSAVDIYGQVKAIQRGSQLSGVGRTGTMGSLTPVSYNQDAFMQNAYFPAIGPMVAGAGSIGSKIGAAIAGLGLGLAADEIAIISGAASRVKCRRRRRRLATHSDIKDLAALKAILGSGKAFDTWIATRKM